MLTGDNGILTQAQNAKEETTKVEEEEKIKMAVMGSSINDDGFVEMIDETSFKNELKNQFGNQKLDVVVNGDGSFIITVEDTQRKYYVNDDKTVINSDNIIEIGTADELMSFRDDVNNGNSYEGKAVLLTSDIALSGEWEPIGYYDQSSNEKNPDVETNKPFRGIFDGGNCTINGIKITTNKSYQGLFSFVVDGTIRNVIIGENNNITGNNRVGGVVGYLYGLEGNISNCINYANINCSGSNIGGIVGKIAGKCEIFNCKNHGNITASGTIGGILGSSNGTDWEQFVNVSNTITNCGNYGEIVNNNINYSSAGIAGYFKGDILNCCNKNRISEGTDIGGIVGGFYGKIENSYNINSISGQNDVGGIVGALAKSIDSTENSIKNCYSLGEVSGIGNVKGDIIGMNYDGEIYNCYTKENTFTAEDLGDAFKDDTNNINGGYPILYWE